MASSGEVIAPVKSVDKLKYLEKYMSGSAKEKKKKRTKIPSTQRLRILDDDVDLKHIPSARSREATPEDDEPAVATVIDERPLHARVAEQYTPAQWKKIGKDAVNEEARGFSKQRGAADDSDESPPRKRHQACYRSRHDSDSDLSPERPGAAVEPPAKHGELVRNYRNRGSPPAEPVSKNSRHRSSPRKARQHSGSDTSPRRRPPSPPHSKKEKERSPKKHHASSSSSKRKPDADPSSSSHRHKKDKPSAYCGSSPERFYSDVSEVKVKVEPTDASERTSIRNRSDRGCVSPDEPPDSPQRAPGKRGDTELEHRSSKHKARKSDERLRSPQHKGVKVKMEPLSPRDDCDAQRPRVRHDSDSDLSPARVSGAAEDIDSDLSPKRCKRTGDGAVLGARGGSDSDLSPPRPGAAAKARNRHGGSDSDLSPVRPGRKSESPVAQHSSDSDLSPPRPGRCADSPSRSGKHHRKHNSTADHKKQDRKPSPSRSKHRSASHVKVEKGSPKRKVKEPEKVQEVVKLRDTSKADRAREKAAKEAEMASIYSKWGKGLVQQEQQDQKLAEHLHEMEKPFSRYEGDEDLEKHLKDQEREGDPMLNYMRKKKKKANDTSGRPKYSGPEPPPNRFGILPGYRWDGVDRSNGFEKKLIEVKNNKIATEEVAYKWSVEDL